MLEEYSPGGNGQALDCYLAQLFSGGGGGVAPEKSVTLAKS